MKKIKRFLACLSLSVLIVSPIVTNADGVLKSVQMTQADIISDNEIMEEITAKSAVVMEISTGTVIAEKDSESVMSMSHFAKLMTALLAEEKIENGKLKLDDKVTVSANANSKDAPQVWLDVGESITVDELLKSITVGNANDGCTALAEKVCNTESDFVKTANKKAESLGLKNTKFTDCTGANDDTVSTAFDLALLSGEIMKYDKFIPYYTTWMTNIRNDKVELVSTNRLMRTYKGITGLKSCYSKETGSSLVVTAKRDNMMLSVVLLGCSDEDTKFAEAKKLLNYAFENFEIYEPEIDEKAVEKMKIEGGECLETEVSIRKLENIVIPRGTYRQISCEFKRKESIKAPVLKNSKIGEIVFKNGETELIKGEIVIKNRVEKNSFRFSAKRILLNLFG